MKIKQIRIRKWMNQSKEKRLERLKREFLRGEGKEEEKKDKVVNTELKISLIIYVV